MQIETFWAAGKNWAARLYRNGRTMRTAIAHLRAGWYGAPAGSVGVGGAGKPAKSKVSCRGLINKAIGEAQKMVDSFNGLGVWGQLGQRPASAEVWMEFGYSGKEDGDDADGWDDAVAVRLAKKDCEHVAAVNPAVAEQFKLASREPPAALKQHRKSPIKILEYVEDVGRKMRWADAAAVAIADLQQGGSQLIDPTDHLSATTMPDDAVVEDDEAETADTNDEQQVLA